MPSVNNDQRNKVVGDTCDLGLGSEFLRCKEWVGNTLQDFSKQIEHSSHRVDMLEAGHKDIKEATNRVEARLERAEQDRKSHNDYIANKIRGIETRQDEQDRKDDERHAELVGALNKVVESLDRVVKATDDNTDFIDGLKKNWQKITWIASGIIMASGGVWWVVNWMQKNGMIILFPTGA